MNEDIDLFLGLLQRATAALGNPYFALPIHGQDLPVYRERVYAYELYHQLRVIWPNEWGFTVNGEVDKRKHPTIRGYAVRNRIPDLLVHRPGDMGDNLVILEVKPVSASVPEIAKDLRKLTAFCRDAKYRLGVLLLFGPERDGTVCVRAKCCGALERTGRDADQDLIMVFWQGESSHAAVPIAWD